MTEEKKKIIAKVIIIAFLICLCATLFVGSGLARTIAEIVTMTEFDRSDVMDDLNSASLPDGSAFNLNDFPMSESRKVSIINVVEFCFGYSSTSRSDFGVYIYIYNPDGSKLDNISGANKCEMATEYDAAGVPCGYGKFGLQYLSASKDQNNANVFYKFKILDNAKTLLANADSNYNKHGVRRYDISSLELSRKGVVKDEKTAVGGSFKFSGFVKGYGKDPAAECDLKCSVSDQETLELDVRQTFFRPETVSSLGAGHQNTLNSCYFAVPNSTITSYGKLDQIRAEWYEYKTSPIIVMSDKAMYDSFNAYKGKALPSASGNYSIINGWFGKLKGKYPDHESFYASCNLEPSIRLLTDNNIKRLPLLFYTGDNVANKDFILKGGALGEYIENYTSDSGKDFVPDVKIKGKDISNDLFVNTVDEGRTRGYNIKDLNADDEWNMLSYENADKMNVIEKWLKFGFGTIDTNTDFKNIKTIEQVDSASNEWYINAKDKNVFVDYVNQKKSENQTTFVFRYAMTDYYGEVLSGMYNGKSVGVDMRQQTVFLSFDIIHLRFCKDGVYKVIPVVSSPQDVFNDLTPPLVPDKVDLMALFAKIWKIVKIVLIVIAALFGLLLLIPIVKLIIMPFKWIKKQVDKSYEKSKRKN